MRTRTAVIGAALLFSLTACSEVDNPSASASPKPSPSAATDKPSETSEPSPTVQPALKMGATYKWDDTAEGVSGAVTVFGYEQGLKSAVTAEKAGQPAGYEWAVIDVKSCSMGGTFSATVEPWTLAYEDGARIRTFFLPVDLPRPEYVDGTTLTEGKCLRGKLGFMVPGDERPTAVVYAPVSLDEPQEWAVPTKG